MTPISPPWWKFDVLIGIRKWQDKDEIHRKRVSLCPGVADVGNNCGSHRMIN